MAMEGTTLRRGGFYDNCGKRHKKCQRLVQDQSLAMEKSWVMLMYQTDKEHKENEDGCFTGEVQHAEKSGL